MKKIILLIIALIGLFIGSVVLATGIWNQASNDCNPKLTIANWTNQSGYGDPCWTTSNMSASPGDYINVRIYYHNSSNITNPPGVTATNTRVKLNVPSGSSTSHTISGQITSPQGNYTFNSVHLNISSAQTISWDQTVWYTGNTNPVVTPLLGGQSGAEVVSGNGLLIGNITAGWPSQGSVVVGFQVGNNVPPPPQNCNIERFEADPTSILSGSSSELSWETSNCTSAHISGSNGFYYNVPSNKVGQGFTNVYPNYTTTYTLYAYGANNSQDTQSVTVTVNQIQNCTINSFNANPTSITSGGSSTLSWSTSNCNSVTISNLGYNVPNSGSQQVYPTYTTTYTLTAYGNNGFQISQSVTVSVNQIQNCIISNFNVNPTSINIGQSVNISWSTNNCTSVSVSGPNFNSTSLNNSGQNIYPQNSGTYTINAQGFNGSYATPQSIYVTVNNNNYDNCNIINFTADGETYLEIDEGDAVDLEWNTEDCNSLYISGVGSVSPVNHGEETVYPTYTRTYTLTAYGDNGYSDSRSVTVEVDENNNDNCHIIEFTADGDDEIDIEEGDSVELEWRTEGCDHLSISGGVGSVSPVNHGDETIYPNYSRTYTLTAYDEDGDSDSESVEINVDEDNNDNCRISYFNANPTSVNYGGLSTLSWNTKNCNSVSISNIGMVNYTGNQTVYPASTTNYTIYAYGSSGNSVTRTVQVFVNNYNPPPNPIYNTCAVTTVTTNIGRNSVTLNGLITNSNSYSSNTYFEYGTTVGLGYQTNPRSVNGNSSFSESLTNLSANTIYFYRLVSNCNNTVSKGAIEIFQTLGTQNTTTIIRQGTTVIGTESPIMLKIENRYQSIRVGDIIDYTVTYKNISNKKLTKAILQVILPKGIAYLNSSRGTYVSDTYTLTTQLEDLTPGLEGMVYVQGRVDSIDSGNAQIVTTALLVYTTPKGAQENAIAYVLNNPILDNFSLGALALFGWMFRMGILGWLLLLILILLAILLFRKVSRKDRI